MSGGSRFCVAAALCWTASAPLPIAANDLSRDEEVVFFPTAALFDTASPTVTFFVHGWCYEPEANSIRRQALLDELVEKLQLEKDAAAEKIFRERGSRFLVDNERGQNLLIRLGPRDVPLSASEANGHIRSLLTIPTGEVSRIGKPAVGGSAVIEYKLTTPAGDRRTFAGRAHLLTPDGWSVVSDIDDTIKDSNVLDKRELMRNTLLREFKPVAGMAAAYAGWARGGAAFHYLSASPWQLYPPLAEFCTQHGFPDGSFQMRYFRIQDGSALAMLDAPQTYKLGAIAQLMKDFPKRKFILVGDTGEKDPEIYGESARRHPGRVHLIAVRNVTDESPSNARLQAAFKDVPPANVVLFREAGELPSLEAVGK